MAANPDLPLQEQAIKNARIAYSHLPHGDTKFQECVNDTHRTITEVLKVVAVQEKLFRKKRYTKILQRFNKHTRCLENLSSVIEVVVQTNASIGCPVWAPLKFVLLVSNNQIEVADQISLLLETISEYLPRFEIYQKLQQHPDLQTALLNIFTDIVDFSVQAFTYFGKSSITRLTKSIIRPAKYEFESLIIKLKKHANEADKTAVAIELLRAEESRKVTEKIQIRKWLKAVNTNSTLEDCIKARIDDTCQWLRDHTNFKSWKNSSSSSMKDRILCIQGSRGCGKTILAASVASELRSQQQLVLYFPFSSTNEGRSTLESLIRSFLSQILHEAVDDDAHKLAHDLMLRDESSVSDLWKVFNELCLRTNRTIYCIIDGVDESKDSSSLLFDHIKHCLASNPRMYSMVSAQPQALLELLDTSTWKINIEPEMVQQDIDAFISSELRKYEIFDLSGLTESVSKVLKSEARGMFLWVRLIIDDLRKSATQAEIRKRLTSLPHGLEQTYRQTFSRMVNCLDKHQIQLAKNVLSLLAVSLRNLSVQEIRYAHAVAVNDGAASFEANLLIQPQEKIIAVLGGLINIAEERVQLVHSSLLDFLMCSEDAWADKEDRAISVFRLDREESHRFMAAIIIDYARRDVDYGYAMSSEAEWCVSLGAQHPFLEYTSRYALTHLLSSGPATIKLLSQIKLLIESPARSTVSWLEYAGVLCFEDDSYDLLLPQLEQVSLWLLNSQDYGKVFGDRDPETHLMEKCEKELKRRIHEFGSEDGRTTVWQTLFSYFTPEKSPCNVAIPESSDSEAETAVSDLPRIIRSFLLSSSISRSPKLQHLIFFAQQLRNCKVLTDPLELLLRLLISRAAVVPVPVLLAVGYFYKRLNKLEQALEVFQAAWQKVETRETPIKYIILSGIGDVYYNQKKFASALKSYTRAKEGQERFWEPYHVIVVETTFGIADSLVQLDRFEEAEVLYQQVLSLSETENSAGGTGRSDALRTSTDLAKAFFNKDKLKLAESFHGLVYTAQGATLGVNYETIIRVQDNRAYCYYLWGKYPKAEVLCRQVLSYRKTKMDINYFASMELLAYCLFYLERYIEAELLHRQVYTYREDKLGPENPDTLISINNLADTLFKQGKFQEAEGLYRRILTARENKSGLEDSDILILIDFLAITLFNQDKFEEAEPLYRRVLATRKAKLGANHEDTIQAQVDLFNCLYKQRKFLEAEDLIRYIVAVREATLGASHKDTIQAQIAISGCLHNQGKFLEAEDLSRYIVAAREAALGANHERTIQAQVNLSDCLHEQGKFLEAEQIDRKLLTILEATLGPDNSTTLEVSMDLARDLSRQKKYETAEPIFRRVLDTRERVLGPDDLDTIQSVYYLAISLKNQDRPSEAELLWRRALSMQETVLGRDNPVTVASAWSLAGCLLKQFISTHNWAKLPDAIVHYRQVLYAREVSAGAEDSNTITAASALAVTLFHAGRYREAIPLFERVLNSQKTMFGADHPTTFLTSCNLDRARETEKRRKTLKGNLRRVWKTSWQYRKEHRRKKETRR